MHVCEGRTASGGIAAARKSRFEVWLGVTWSRLTDGAPYAEYREVRRAWSRAEALELARAGTEAGTVLIYDTETGVVFQPQRAGEVGSLA